MSGSGSAPSAFRRRWKAFVDVATGVWLVLFFVVFLHVDLPLVAVLDAHTLDVLERVLFGMIAVYATDLYLRFRWSGLSLPRFMRKRWFDILLILPIFRPLRLMRIFRAGRGARILFLAARGKRMYGIFRKSRRTVRAMRARRAARAAVAAGAAATATVAGAAGGLTLEPATPAAEDTA